MLPNNYVREPNGNIRMYILNNGGTVYNGTAGNSATTVAHSFGNTNALSTPGAKIANFCINNANTTATEAANIDVYGRYNMAATDATGTPGAVTVNKAAGQVAIAAGASSVVVTNSLVTTASIVLVVLQRVDATLTQILSVVPGAGSFTIRGNANATATTTMGFVVHN